MHYSSKISKTGRLYVLGTLYPVYTGGMEIFNYYFLNYQLKKSGDFIYYVGQEKTDLDLGNFIYLKKRKPTRFFYPFQFLAVILKLRKHLRYVYISYAEQSWIISFSQSFILRIFKIPYIVTIHWGKEPDWRFKAPYLYYFRQAHTIIGVSEPICKAFKKAIPELEFMYVPPLIPFQRAEPEQDLLKRQLQFSKQDRILLYIGSLKPMKNPDLIVEAFQILGVDFLRLNHIRLVFAGNGEMEADLRKRVEKYDLGGYIRFEGLVSREKVPFLYKAADFYIISSDYEGTSLSLLEAMFNQLAIIASDAPGINEMLRHEENALLYETKNIKSLAATLRRIFLDPSLSESISKKAADDFKTRYSYETMMEIYESVFSSV